MIRLVGILLLSFAFAPSAYAAGGVRRWLSQHIRGRVCSRRVAASYARSERMPGHGPGIAPLRPLSPMEPPIHDVHSHLNGRTQHEKPPLGASPATAVYALRPRGTLGAFRE